MKQSLKLLLLFFSFIIFTNNTANAEGSGSSENTFGSNNSTYWRSLNVKFCATSDFSVLYKDISDCNSKLKYSNLARKKIPLIKINAEMYSQMKRVDRKVGNRIAASKEKFGIDNSDKFYEMVVEERRKIYEKLKVELEKELNLSKITTANLPKNSYKGNICLKTNKNSWTPGKPLKYEDMYIFNDLSNCKSISYNAERATYEKFLEIKSNPSLYVENSYKLKDLRKKFNNKICLNQTTGKISNVTKLCDKNEKELVISNESSKYSIILVSKNSNEKTKIAKVTPKPYEINLSNCRETDLISNRLINNDPIIFDKININLINGYTVAKSKNKIYRTKTKIDDNYDPTFDETLKVMFPSGYNLVILKINHKLGIIEHGQYGNVKLVCQKINGTNTKYADLFKNIVTNVAKKETTTKPEKKVKIAKKEPKKEKKKVKVAKVKEPKQKEFIPKKTSQDNDPPVIKIAESITVNDSSYEISGTLEDKSKKLFIEVDGQTIPVKKGKFKLKRYSPINEKVKIVAIDQWGNKSKPKTVNIIVDIKNIEIAEKIEPLNPTKIRSKKNSNRVALIIGVEKYIRTPSANFANLDAKFFYEYSRKGFGIPKSNIKLLVDEDANLVKSLSTFSKWLPSKVQPGETELIIFFAGHGLASSDGKELYILPHDSDPDLLSRTALSRSELFKQIIDLNPKSVTMFMDTCYSGISRDEKMLLASARPVRIVADDENEIPNNFTIFTASQLNQISSGMNEIKHGIFSYYLMKGLEGNADTNKDRVITNGELLSYMDKNISEKASILGRQQKPSLAGDPNKTLMTY